MSKTKVLLLISTSIDCKGLNASPRYVNYHFYQFALNDILNNDNVNEQVKLITKICNVIDAINPKFIIVHLGIAFEHYPFDLMTAVIATHKKFPQIKIGFDKRKDYIIQKLKLTRKYLPELANMIKEINNIETDYDDQELFLLSKIF